MDVLSMLFDGVEKMIPMGAGILGIIIVLVLARLIVGKRYGGEPGYPFRRQLVTLIILLIGLVAVILLMPIADHTKGQLLSLLGILLSAAIALSSATFVGNVMAGLMLRVIRNFRGGDFIQVGDYFGRISERGLLHIEIQTEDRDLTTLPNLYLVSHPVKVIRSSGTIISAEISLGYDIPHTKIESLLLKSAENASLQEPFVQLLELGDFSISYRIAGLLTEVKHIIAARSNLRKMILDEMHQNNIEIVSPTFMNTRAVDASKFIPAIQPVSKPIIDNGETGIPEELLFDKADQAESIEKLRETYERLGEEIDKLKLKRDNEHDRNSSERFNNLRNQLKARREKITGIIKQRENDKKGK
jgi:small conductance mechanosensitive channel